MSATLTALLRSADLRAAVHERFPDLPVVEPRARTCWHGHAAGACDQCARDRLRKRRGKRN